MSASFGATSTTEDVLAGVDLTGKRILVTGVSAGLGVETARALTAHGAEVVGAARNLDKARNALKEAGIDIDLVEVDLGSLASIREATDRLNADGRKFDVVIANAGVMATPKMQTTDGFEFQFGTNHLGHFTFINRIEPLIKDGGRVVSLASSGHRFSNVNLDDPNFETTEYTPFGAYGRSKTANVLFAVEFDRRHKWRGVRAAAVHPGGIQTELSRYMTEEALNEIRERMESRQTADGQPFRFKTVPQGAATSVWAAVVAGDDEVGGRYCEDCQATTRITDEEFDAASGGVRPYAVDPANAAALWTKSEEMVGEAF
ncbi:MAG: SDR family NAD(P)-dependent oxidoreductase [Hyphomonas sp.]|nr:SDR family NAD(P)-dependent oxidoreductase [Hyphomonas sp.]